MQADFGLDRNCAAHLLQRSDSSGRSAGEASDSGIFNLTASGVKHAEQISLEPTDSSYSSSDNQLDASSMATASTASPVGSSPSALALAGRASSDLKQGGHTRRLPRMSMLVGARRALVTKLIAFRHGRQLTYHKSLHRVDHKWVPVTLNPQEMQYYALLQAEFEHQLKTGNRQQTDVEMLEALRVAANAVELLPRPVQSQLQLEKLGTIPPPTQPFLDILQRYLPPPPASLATLVSPRSPCTNGTPRGLPTRSGGNSGFKASQSMGPPAELPPMPKTGMRRERTTTDTPRDARSALGTSPIDQVMRSIACWKEGKSHQRHSWVLSNKYQTIIACIKHELERAAQLKASFPRFVVVSDYRAMVEGFSRTLAASPLIKYDVICGTKDRVMSSKPLKNFGASLEPRLLLYHSSVVNPKDDLSTTTHLYFMNPWPEQKAKSVLLQCVLGDSLTGQLVTVVDFISTDTIEAEAMLQVGVDDGESTDVTDCF